MGLSSCVLKNSACAKNSTVRESYNVHLSHIIQVVEDVFPRLFGLDGRFTLMFIG